MTELLDLCEFIVDCEHKTAPIQTEGYPSIRTPNIGKGMLILEGVNRVSESTYIDWTRRAVPRAGDLILAREAPVGNVAVVPEGLECCLGQRTVLIRPKVSEVDPYYLCYYLLTPATQGQLLGKSGGATVHHLNMKDIRALPIPVLPDPTEQGAVAGVIKSYDDLIDANRKRIALLEESARLLYREWFVDLRFPGHESVKRVNGVPKGWVMKSIASMASFLSRGITPKYDDSAKSIVINQKCIRGGRLDLKLARRQSREVKSDRLIRIGDVLINSTGAGTLGRVAQVRVEIPDCTVDTHITIVRPLESENAAFLGVALLELETVLAGMGVGSTNQLELGRAAIGELVVMAPPLAMRRNFQELIWRNFVQAEMLAQSNQILIEARDALLSKLMSGELRV